MHSLLLMSFSEAFFNRLSGVYDANRLGFAATMRPHRTPTVFSNRPRVPKSQRTRQLHATEFLASQMERARGFPNPAIPLREPGRVVAAGSYYRSRCGNWRFSHSCTESPRRSSYITRLRLRTASSCFLRLSLSTCHAGGAGGSCGGFRW